jgi:hypothetical protein
MQYNRAELNGSTKTYETEKHVKISEKKGLEGTLKIREKIMKEVTEMAV